MKSMFKISKSVGTPTPPFEYLPGTSEESFSDGEALVLSSGKLTKCGATAAPEFVCVGAHTGDGASLIPVMRVNETLEFESTFAAAPTSLNPGDKVTLHTDGLQVTATTTAGVFTLSRIDGTASGATCAGYFRR